MVAQIPGEGEIITGEETSKRTFFGRYYSAFNALENAVRGRNHLECLVIGPGKMDVIGDDSLLASFQPFELANALERAGALDYHITVADNNEKVLEEYDKSKNVVIINSDFYYFAIMGFYVNSHSQEGQELMRMGEEYYKDFFPEHSISIEKHGDSIAERKRVVIPERILKRIKAIKFDLMSQPVLEADIVICTTLLSHYRDEPRIAMHAAKKQEEMIHAVRAGGYCMLSDEIEPRPGFEQIYFIRGNDGKKHSCGVTVLHRV